MRDFLPEDVRRREYVIGIITRTDLLRFMYAGVHGRGERVYDIAKDDIPVRRRHLEGVMHKHLSSRVFRNLNDLDLYAWGLPPYA